MAAVVFLLKFFLLLLPHTVLGEVSNALCIASCLGLRESIACWVATSFEANFLAFIRDCKYSVLLDLVNLAVWCSALCGCLDIVVPMTWHLDVTHASV